MPKLPLTQAGFGWEMLRFVELPLSARSLWRTSVGSSRLTMQEIIEAVSRAYGVSVEDIKGQARFKQIYVPRHHAIWIMTQQEHLSLPMIGRFMGGRDHTTCINARRRHEERASRAAAEHRAQEAA